MWCTRKQAMLITLHWNANICFKSITSWFNFGETTPILKVWKQVTRNLWQNTNDLQTSTLVGPTRYNLVYSPLAVAVDNRLQTYKICSAWEIQLWISEKQVYSIWEQKWFTIESTLTIDICDTDGQNNDNIVFQLILLSQGKKRI